MKLFRESRHGQFCLAMSQSDKPLTTRQLHNLVRPDCKSVSTTGAMLWEMSYRYGLTAIEIVKGKRVYHLLGRGRLLLETNPKLSDVLPIRRPRTR